MSRIEKVSEAIKQEVSKIIHDELRDPRLGFITVMQVEVTKDLRIARVFYSVMGSPEQKLKAGEALESASGFIRRLIGERLNLRVTPEVIFKLDNSVDYSIEIAEKIERVKDELKKGRKPDKGKQ